MRDMCGRFAFQGQHWPDIVADIDKPHFEPNYNICPQDSVPVIHLDAGNTAVTSMRWGLRPSWNKESTMEPINARIETVESKPMFRDAYHHRRCLVPADGWYEWKTTPRGKVPFYHTLDNQKIVLMAGIYEQWKSDDGLLSTFTLLTRDASPDIEHIHNRMPVLITPNEGTSWMERSLLSPTPSNILVHPVGREVNKTTAQGPQLIQRIRTLFD